MVFWVGLGAEKLGFEKISQKLLNGLDHEGCCDAIAQGRFNGVLEGICAASTRSACPFEMD